MGGASSFGRNSSADDVLAGLDLSQRRMVVTGANTGIGFETARALAARGAHVVLACRDAARGQAALAAIRTRHPEARVELGSLDLSSLQSVRGFATGLGSEPVHSLVCNAGVYESSYQETREGFERTVGVCHIGHFALFRAVCDRLLAAGDGRVVMVSSESHRSPATLDFTRLPLPREHYKALVAYGQAKLCNVLMAKEIERRFGERGVHACALHPGTFVATDIGRNSLAARLIMTAARPFTKSIAQGAATSVLCAAHPDVALGGEYFVDCQPRRSSRESCDAGVARRLWELSEAWTGMDPVG